MKFIDLSKIAQDHKADGWDNPIYHVWVRADTIERIVVKAKDSNFVVTLIAMGDSLMGEFTTRDAAEKFVAEIIKQCEGK